MNNEVFATAGVSIASYVHVEFEFGMTSTPNTIAFISSQSV
jgi:hypothetical protein